MKDYSMLFQYFFGLATDCAMIDLLKKSQLIFVCFLVSYIQMQDIYKRQPIVVDF